MTTTTTVKRCDCCDLPVESCGKAAAQRLDAERATERHRLLNLPGWFPANYPGTCCGCGEWFGVGQPIHRAKRGVDNPWRCCE